MGNNTVMKIAVCVSAVTLVMSLASLMVCRLGGYEHLEPQGRRSGPPVVRRLQILG